MKTLVIRLCVLFIVIASFVFKSYSERSISHIKYVITLNKTQFVEGEEIMINIKFINEGHETDSLININEIEILKGLFIKDSHGNNSDYTGPVELKEKNIVLNPREEFSISSPLKFYRAHAAVCLFRYFPKDTYNIKGYYNNGKTFLESNEINFKVIAPFGVENEVFREVLEINKISPIDSAQYIINRYDYLLKNHPSSLYIDEIFLNAIIQRRITSIKYDSTLIQDCLWFIEKNPNSKHIDFAINEAAEILYYKYGGKDAAINFLLNLKNSYPNSQISFEAQKSISKFENK